MRNVVVHSLLRSNDVSAGELKTLSSEDLRMKILTVHFLPQADKAN